MSDTTRRTSSRRIHFFGTVFPLLMLLIYGITFALIGEKTLYRLDISYSTYETLRMFLGVLIPILFLLWGVAGTIIAERKTLSRGELTIRFCILACSTVIVIGTCYQEQLITRERFRDHDCRAETVFCKRNITALPQFTKGRILSVFRPGFIIRPASRCDGFAGQS